MTRAGLALALLLLAGCASGPEPGASSSGAKGAPAGSWWVEPEAAEVAAFRERFVALADAPACQDALAARSPEVAHALFVADPDPAVRAALGRALAPRARVVAPNPYAASLAADAAEGRALLLRALGAPRTAPDAIVAEAQAAAKRLGEAPADPLLAVEAAQLARAFGGAAEGADEADEADELAERPASPAPLQAVRAALLAARGDRAQVERAVELAAATGDLATLERLASLVELGALPAPGRAWRADAARAALSRGQGLRALKHALALEGRGPEAGPAPRLQDRLLVARAQLAAGQLEPALDEGLAVAEAAAGLATEPALEGAAHALAGDALLALGKPEPALEAYARAEAAFGRAQDPAGVYRQGLNRAAAALRAGASGAATTAFEGLGPQPVAELGLRRSILERLAALLAGTTTGQAAARDVEATLVQAKQQGALDLVEQYRDLPARLRAGPRPPPRGS